MGAKHGQLNWPALAVAVAVIAAAVCILFRFAAGPEAPLVPSPRLDTVVLSPDRRIMPGAVPATVLRYRNPAVFSALICGSWDHWDKKAAMEHAAGEWRFDLAGLDLELGYYEFKFMPDGDWEPGENRTLFVNGEGVMERPLDMILAARIEAPDRIDVLFKGYSAASGAIRGNDPTASGALPATENRNLTIRILPETPVKSFNWLPGSAGDCRQLGFYVSGDIAGFIFDPSVYSYRPRPASRVTVAGTFNGWNPSGGIDDRWLLGDPDEQGVRQMTIPLAQLGAPPVEGRQFKFVVNEKRWLDPPQAARNAVGDGKGNSNLGLKPSLSREPVLQIFTEDPLDLSNSYSLVIQGLMKRSLFHGVTPGGIMDRFHSELPLGAILNRELGTTAYRLFAPRAKSVHLCLFDSPERPSSVSAGNGAAAESSAHAPRVVPMSPDSETGIWQIEQTGINEGGYYAFLVDGPRGRGEGFVPELPIGDPYARAAAHAHNNTIVIDPAGTNEWFPGWTDGGYLTPSASEAVIYEAHIRDLTSHDSSGVSVNMRGKYAGLLATEGKGTGLDHLGELGVNMIEILPVSEFGNGTNNYDWGYGPVFYFAPEASCGMAPLKGSQYYEFKNLVNELHERGFGVILDVVYNHVGSPNIFHAIDRKYYFRMNQDFELSNYSGCGNDLRTEAPMMRRLIVDNVVYWMKEFHVDGFRFDLAELVDMETLMEVRDRAREINPDVLLISESWSLRGDHKQMLKGTGWSAWNNEFRDSVKAFILGHGNRESLMRAIRGSVDSWAAGPTQSVNYLESHDDRTLADDISSRPGGDGSVITREDAARNRLGATILFTSLGIPMLAEGQEFLRSKRGLHNTYNKGDELNAVRWTDRERPVAAETLAYYTGLIKLRQGEAGRPLRLSGKVPEDYFDWILPSNQKAIGYIINPRRGYPGPAILVLLNGDTESFRFTVDFPEGKWKMVGDGRRIMMDGIGEDAQSGISGKRRIKVPALSSCMFVGE